MKLQQNPTHKNNANHFLSFGRRLKIQVHCWKFFFTTNISNLCHIRIACMLSITPLLFAFSDIL